MKKSLFLLLSICCLSVNAQNSHTINTVGSTFSPSSLTINVGDTVIWNNTAGFHNVNAAQASFPNNPDGFGNAVAGAGWSFQWIFTMAGTYDYQCDPHAPAMSGVIIANALAQPLTYVPDSTFEAYLEANGMGNGIPNDSNVLTANINTVTYLDVSNDSITDLTGIEDFTALTYLNCYNNQLTSLDVSTNTALNYLDCSYNQLSNLDISNNTALTNLDCAWNQLDILDVSANTVLTKLECHHNQLSTLDLRNGINTSISTFSTKYNSTLYCIDVDDVAWSDTNWTVANGNIDSTMSFSTNCSWIQAENLFFSEYGEGSGNNKYFEIYNPTSDTVDLTNYAFARVSNAPTNIGVYEFSTSRYGFWIT